MDYEENPMLQNLVKKPKKPNKLIIIMGSIILVCLVIILILALRKPEVINTETLRKQSLDDVALELEYFIDVNGLDALDSYGFENVNRVAIDNACSGVYNCTEISGEYVERFVADIFDKKVIFSNINCELNDGVLYTYDANENKYKLFKSPTEGNFIVYLTNISLQPNTTLNRFLYTFSATASEVMENTIENLQQFNIQNFGSYNTESTFTDTSFGQLNDNYIGIYSKDESGQYTIENDNPTNLINEIEKFVNVSTETSIYKLNKILEFKISINDPTIESLIFILDGQEILIKNGKTYTLINYNPKTLYLKQTAEVLIDFKYEVIITSIAADYLNFNFQTYSPWGQIEGLYENISLLDLIKEQSKIETEKNQLDSESLNIYKEDLNLYTNDNNTKAYSFISLSYFDIDALEGTKIQLVGFDDKLQDIIIGPTERYTLNLKENIIKDIKLIDSANILINYKTLVLYSNTREGG